jgi:hypothetical protein
MTMLRSVSQLLGTDHADPSLRAIKTGIVRRAAELHSFMRPLAAADEPAMPNTFMSSG